MFFQFIFDKHKLDAIAGFNAEQEPVITTDTQTQPWGNTGQEVLTQINWSVDFSMFSDENKAKIANALLADLGIDEKVEFEHKKVAKLS